MDHITKKVREIIIEESGLDEALLKKNDSFGSVFGNSEAERLYQRLNRTFDVIIKYDHKIRYKSLGFMLENYVNHYAIIKKRRGEAPFADPEPNPFL